LLALVVCGAEDRYSAAKLAHRSGDHLPRTELRVLDGAGHFM
jgi:pimeloyl-ACP methyl ester carboxylesterase